MELRTDYSNVSFANNGKLKQELVSPKTNTASGLMAAINL